ncbi:MAG: DDE-type integrase/transposase/recombinase [Gammaproteobacteria bacterium]|jgi:putative transposase|nr:hypothetical protein [Gammaproteobacteria bacterium]MDP6096934.1 DDE-type integrase/transposase/recombinase [Gammaproteobacteria bacterium]MDP7455688.1 DDE-type integrase/transposase/recombinase [Gammaproteobacteria bacterium]HJO12545.1 DDE-type integrase/transposase/recombinase [Gammaproteobacteria bacterium]|tara:strand:- start:2261 stop:2416 length:156 start_codon:yes stop_codon:yes gene_type:complete
MTQGKQHYLWRTADKDGEAVDVFLQKRRDVRAAKRFMAHLKFDVIALILSF